MSLSLEKEGVDLPLAGVYPGRTRQRATEPGMMWAGACSGAEVAVGASGPGQRMTPGAGSEEGRRCF